MSDVERSLNHWKPGYGSSSFHAMSGFNRRAMIMENLFFVGIVFTIGVILYSCWKLFESNRQRPTIRAESKLPIPPNKRVISGACTVEEAQVEFQERIETWQRTQMPRWNGLRNSADALSGQKYQFEQRPRSGLIRGARQGVTKRDPRRFELLN